MLMVNLFISDLFRKEPLLGHSEGHIASGDHANMDGMNGGPRIIVKGRQPKGPVHDGITIIPLDRLYRWITITFTLFKFVKHLACG